MIEMRVTSNKLYYFGSFDTLRDKHELRVSPACCNKMEYVSGALSEIGLECEIVSLAEPNSKKPGISKAYRKDVGDIKVRFFSAITGKNLLCKIIQFFLRKFQIIWFLVTHVRRNTTVLLYHTTAHMEIFALIRLILRPRFILEVEEVYDKVSKVDFIHRRLERMIFGVSDSYIFPTEILNEQVNTGNKPSAIIYGSYKLPEIVHQKEKGKIHAVYSGTFNPRKGGAMAAIEAAKYLDSNYHLHITGWGTDKETEVVKRKLEEISKETACTLTFDGFVDEKDFHGYLQQFHIGICSQNPDDILSSFCFPSKILVYMGNGLSVVSSKTEVIERCSMSDSISVYETQNGKAIARAIEETGVDNNNRDIVKELNKKCLDSLNVLMNMKTSVMQTVRGGVKRWIRNSIVVSFLGGMRAFYWKYLKNYRKRMGYCHPTAQVSRPLMIKGPENVYLYEGTKISDAIIMTPYNKFVLKRNSLTTEGLMVLTGNHERRIGRFFNSIKQSEKVEGLDADVVVEEDCWIGVNVTLLMGVTIRRGTTVAAGAVVSKSTAPYSVVGGVPAKHIKFYWTIEQIIEHEKGLYPENERFTRKELENYFNQYSK